MMRTVQRYSTELLQTKVDDMATPTQPTYFLNEFSIRTLTLHTVSFGLAVARPLKLPV